MPSQRMTPRTHGVLGRTLDRRQVLQQGAILGVGIPALAAQVRTWVPVSAQEAVTPPDAPRHPPFNLPWRLGGDPYRWLENPDDPEVIAYLEAENAYTEAVMAPTGKLQEELYQELTGRIQQTDATVPTRWNGYLYYQRTEEGKDYGIICRKRGSMEAPEQILLDLNTMAGDYLDLSTWRPSPDNRYLAYSIDETGEEFYPLFVMDMSSGQVIAELPPSWDAVWAQDSRTLYYCRQDAVHRPYQLNRHIIGADPATDALLYQEEDENFWLRIYPAKDRSYLFLESSTFDTFEVSALPLDQPTVELVLVAPRTDGVQHYLEHHGEKFLILTDEDAPNFKLMAAPVADPAHANWREVIAHRDDVLINPYGVEPFARHLVIYGREDGFSKIWVRDVGSGTMMPIPFEEATYVATVTDRFTGGENWEFETDTVNVNYSSPVTPDSVYAIDMVSGNRTLLKQQEVVGGHDPARYVTQRLFSTAPDGTQIPISLVALREPPAGLPPGPRPMRLDGYGGYGASSDPYFSIYRLALIDRGVSHAIAHIRGGLELGRSWWEEGRLLNKKNCFSDFIACAEHLITEGRTAPDRLAVHGGSNGGLLMGVVANERPDLFRVVVAEVPITDMIGFLLRTSIGPVNQDEFGDPHDPTVYAYQRSYSPYQNVAAQDYPAMFVTGGLTDNRVPYWQPAKWVARLRDWKTDDNPLLLRTEMASGHLGVTAFYDLGRELALWYAFILQEFGIAEIQPSAIVATPAPQAAKRPSASALSAQTTSSGLSPLGSTARPRMASRTAQTWSRARQ